MTYQNDPNINRREPLDTNRSNTGMWVAGILAVMVVLSLVVFGMSRTDNVASNDRPTTTATTTTGSGATTTGSGASTRTTPPTNAPASR